MGRLGFILGFLLIAALAAYAVLHTADWFRLGSQHAIDPPGASAEPQSSTGETVPTKVEATAPASPDTTSKSLSADSLTPALPFEAATQTADAAGDSESSTTDETLPPPAEPPLPADIVSSPAAESSAGGVAGIAQENKAQENKPAHPAATTTPAETSTPPTGTEPEPQWQPFWGPFNNATSAARFAAELKQRTGVEIRPLETRPGRFMVAYAYHDEAERQSNRTTIEERAAIKIEFRQ